MEGTLEKSDIEHVNHPPESQIQKGLVKAGSEVDQL